MTSGEHSLGDIRTVPADGRTPVYLLNLILGSLINIDGPDPDAFEVTDDSLALAFDTPGQYDISVRAPGAVPAFCLRVEATHV